MAAAAYRHLNVGVVLWLGCCRLLWNIVSMWNGPQLSKFDWHYKRQRSTIALINCSHHIVNARKPVRYDRPHNFWHLQIGVVWFHFVFMVSNNSNSISSGSWWWVSSAIISDPSRSSFAVPVRHLLPKNFKKCWSTSEEMRKLLIIFLTFLTFHPKSQTCFHFFPFFNFPPSRYATPKATFPSSINRLLCTAFGSNGNWHILIDFSEW